jgi:hypothetical protein
MSDEEFISISTSAGLPLAPGFYESRIVDIELADGKYDPQYQFVFEVEGERDEHGSLMRVKGWTGRKITTGTKLGRWLAKLDEFPPKGTAYNVRRVIGFRCQLVIKSDDEGRSVLADIERSKRSIVAFTEQGRPIYEGDTDAPADDEQAVA